MGLIGVIKNGVKTKVAAKLPNLFPASRTTFDNSGTGLSSNRVQGAIVELDSGKVSESGDTMSGSLTINQPSASASSEQPSVLTLGNSTPTGTVGNSRGYLKLFGKNDKYVQMRAGEPSANVTLELPTSSGTIALKSDIARETKSITTDSAGDYSYTQNGSGNGIYLFTVNTVGNFGYNIFFERTNGSHTYIIHVRNSNGSAVASTTITVDFNYFVI